MNQPYRVIFKFYIDKTRYQWLLFRIPGEYGAFATPMKLPKNWLLISEKDIWQN